jgi:hypothetical protein
MGCDSDIFTCLLVGEFLTGQFLVALLALSRSEKSEIVTRTKVPESGVHHRNLLKKRMLTVTRLLTNL